MISATVNTAGESQQHTQNDMNAAVADQGTAFSFGDPVPVVDKIDLMGYIECVKMQNWYEPPLSFEGLAKSLSAAVHHSSPIYFKRDVLASCFVPCR